MVTMLGNECLWLWQGSQYRTGMYTGIGTSLFRTGLNTGHISQFRVIPVGIEKSFYFLFIYFFLSFVIFEFLLAHNDNLFALTY